MAVHRIGVSPARAWMSTVQAEANRLYTLSPEGRLLEAAVVPAIRSRPGPVPDCGYALGAGESVTVSMTSSIYGFKWMVQSTPTRRRRAG